MKDVDNNNKNIENLDKQLKKSHYEYTMKVTELQNIEKKIIIFFLNLKYI